MVGFLMKDSRCNAVADYSARWETHNALRSVPVPTSHRRHPSPVPLSILASEESSENILWFVMSLVKCYHCTEVQTGVHIPGKEHSKATVAAQRVEAIYRICILVLA